jgi:HEAT repeat protein
LDDIRKSEDPKFLIGVFRTGSDEERSAAADRFVSLPNSKFVPLVQAFKDPDHSVRMWSAVSMGRIQDNLFAPQLIDLLMDDVETVRDAAFTALKALVSEDALFGLISAERGRTNSAERSARLDPYLAKMITEPRSVHAGTDETKSTGFGKPCTVILMARRALGHGDTPLQSRRRTVLN